MSRSSPSSPYSVALGPRSVSLPVPPYSRSASKPPAEAVMSSSPAPPISVSAVPGDSAQPPLMVSLPAPPSM
jgi:hypothetical protein